jgi:hypothetical protein
MNLEPVSIQLPRNYDVNLLQRDLEALRDFAQAPQPGPYHAGEWTGIALHSMGGKQSVFPSAAGLETYQYTDAIRVTPYFRQILDELRCPKEVVRVLTLPPGGHIKEHYDFHTNFQFGLVRLHIPLVTHPDVVFFIDGQRMNWKEGELWYGDFSKVHWIKNESSVTRVHLVIDSQINDFLLSLFPQDYIERRRAEGISITRKPHSVSDADLRRYLCDFQIPGEFLPMFTIGKDMRTLRKGARAAVRLINGKLVTLLDGEPAFVLQRVSGDTFGISGLPNGITLQFREDGSEVQEVILNLKGLPMDLYFARLGRMRGPAVPDRAVSLSVLGRNVAPI